MLRQVPDDAEAIFIGGDGFRTARTIERLEQALGRPVLTANQALLWRLLTQIAAPGELDGYGRLFAPAVIAIGSSARTRKPPSAASASRFAFTTFAAAHG